MVFAVKLALQIHQSVGGSNFFLLFCAIKLGVTLSLLTSTYVGNDICVEVFVTESMLHLIIGCIWNSFDILPEGLIVMSVT